MENRQEEPDIGDFYGPRLEVSCIVSCKLEISDMDISKCSGDWESTQEGDSSIGEKLASLCLTTFHCFFSTTRLK